ncbi:MAG TPA: hypothetical protein VJB66_04015 [Candidatus Nanoarchaeia archaeon]|nr:hypothetical protein [Candidatus Nanoarchaeia archaeon]
MEKTQILKALEQLKDDKKKFVQSYDLIITLKDINTKTAPVDAFVVMPHTRGKTVKVCAVVGQELAEQASKQCDLVIRETELLKYRDNKAAKKLAGEYDFFLAQITLMPQIAQYFGRSFGPRGKMPNPKAGCVVAPTANLSVVKERLQKTVHVKSKEALALQCIIGNESMDIEQVADNILAVVTQVSKALPNEDQNVKAVFIKKTMSKPIKV